MMKKVWQQQIMQRRTILSLFYGLLECKPGWRFAARSTLNRRIEVSHIRKNKTKPIHVQNKSLLHFRSDSQSQVSLNRTVTCSMALYPALRVISKLIGDSWGDRASKNVRRMNVSHTRAVIKKLLQEAVENLGQRLWRRRTLGNL